MSDAPRRGARYPPGRGENKAGSDVAMADAAAKDKGSELKIRGQADAEKRKSKWDDERKPVRQIFC